MDNILKKIELEIANRNLDNDDIAEILSLSEPMKTRRIIAGYASVAIYDREGHRITIPALKEAVRRHMKESFYRPVNVFHSDVTVGRVLPKWTHPDTGETFVTKVDDKGWYVVCEVRDDIEIANKVWREIEKGNIKSFSIAGSSKKKESAGGTKLDIEQLDIYETTLCLAKNEKIWTKQGLKNVQDITTNDFVLSHTGKWRKVLNTMSREVNEKIIKINTNEGCLTCTKEHPVRTLIYGGRHTGTKYDWKEAGKLKIGNLISMHKYFGNCKYCGAPLFEGSHSFQNKNYCDAKCRFLAPGNRLGSTYKSKLKGITKKDNPNLSGGIKTKEGFAKLRKALSTDNFKEKCKQRATNQWKNPGYIQSQIKARVGQNKLEKEFEKLLGELFPNEWKFVGNGQVMINRKFPDFVNINGQKKIIELFGDYWHKGENPQDRINIFAEFGYETLVVWESEFKKNKKETIKKVKEFCNNKLSKINNIEEIQYIGKVYNIEVDIDNSYTTEFAVVHNCETPVNQMSKFDVLYNPNKVDINSML